MISYIVYLCVTILVLYIYFIKTYPSVAGQFINKDILSGKKQKIVKAENISNPMHMESALSIWMRYDKVLYRRGEEKYVLTKGNRNHSLQMPSIVIHPTLNKLSVIVEYSVNKGGLEKNDKKFKIDYDIPMSKWFNLVIVTKNGEIQAYYNGKLKKSIVVNGHPKYNNSDMMINYEKGFDGYIQNIQYFDSALSGENINKLYYMGPMYDGTVSFYSFLFGKIFYFIFMPLKLLSKLLFNIFTKLNLDKLLGLNIRAAICGKDLS